MTWFDLIIERPCEKWRRWLEFCAQLVVCVEKLNKKNNTFTEDHVQMSNHTSGSAALTLTICHVGVTSAGVIYPVKHTQLALISTRFDSIYSCSFLYPISHLPLFFQVKDESCSPRAGVGWMRCWRPGVIFLQARRHIWLQPMHSRACFLVRTDRQRGAV